MSETENTTVEQAADALTDVTKSITFGDRYLRGRPFLVVGAHGHAAPHVKTIKAGWTKEAQNWSLYEQPSVVDRVSDKMLREAVVIIDVLNSKLIKNRLANQADDATVLQHFMSRYSGEITQGLDVWARQNAPTPSVTEKIEAELGPDAE